MPDFSVSRCAALRGKRVHSSPALEDPGGPIAPCLRLQWWCTIVWTTAPQHRTGGRFREGSKSCQTWRATHLARCTPLRMQIADGAWCAFKAFWDCCVESGVGKHTAGLRDGEGKTGSQTANKCLRPPTEWHNEEQGRRSHGEARIPG